MILYMDIIKQLEQHRLEHRISQEGLAKKLKVHFSTVNRWFMGHQKPNKMQEYHIRKLLKGKGE